MEWIILLILIATCELWVPPLFAAWLGVTFPKALGLSILILWVGLPIACWTAAHVQDFFDPLRRVSRKAKKLHPLVDKTIKQINPSYEVLPKVDWSDNTLGELQRGKEGPGGEKVYEFGWWIREGDFIIADIILYTSGRLSVPSRSFSISRPYYLPATEEVVFKIKEALQNAGFEVVSQN